MISSHSFFTIQILFAFYVFPLLVESSLRYSKPRARKGLAKRLPEGELCAGIEEWNERRCNGRASKLAWVDNCWNPLTKMWHEYPSECEGGYICTDTIDNENEFVIECLESAGEIIDPQPGTGQNYLSGNWVDGEDEDDQDMAGEALWGGQVIDIGGGIPPNSADPGVPYEVVRFMNTTIMEASFTAALLSHSGTFIVQPHLPLTVTRGNLNVPLCTFNADRRRCEPTEKLDLWHGDRITIKFSLVTSQAVYLVFTYFGPKAHARPQHARLLFDRETD